ncbi:Hypothetical protein AJAP_28125 [Amycolatopsis japonica]|uniref:Uncharacterized protein n=1 Tax=Amycolatopsis japonica TaxID=208439 RepID=A0A075UZQ9_9PSEU|nr:DUF5403 family protein [Amycolatopsis japonica]AIG78463.1 Hypothetical protein AJAP_28125 [Amycolatopsis japonica]
MAYVYSDRTVNRIVSRLEGVRAAVADAALEIAADAEARLAGHRETGRARIEVEQGRVDSYVYLVDEAALSIEFGHWVEGAYKPNVPTYVEGLYIISGAAGLI